MVVVLFHYGHVLAPPALEAKHMFLSHGLALPSARSAPARGGGGGAAAAAAAAAAARAKGKAPPTPTTVGSAVLVVQGRDLVSGGFPAPPVPAASAKVMKRGKGAPVA